MKKDIIMGFNQIEIPAFVDEMRGVNMLRILLADDEPVFLSKLEKLVQQYSDAMKINALVQKYTCDDMSSIVLSTFDIAFLDIDFGSASGSGLDIARRIRQHREDTVIIFVTNYVEYAPEGYEVKAFRYLLKSDINSKLRGYFIEAVEQLFSKREMITIQNNGELTNIVVDDILFLESDKHIIRINMLNDKRKQYNCYSTLRGFAHKLEPLGFLRVHKSYLVNMRHISKLHCREVILKTGLSLSVSEKNYSEIKQQYLLWKGNQIWNT